MAHLLYLQVNQNFETHINSKFVIILKIIYKDKPLTPHSQKWAGLRI